MKRVIYFLIMMCISTLVLTGCNEEGGTHAEVKMSEQSGGGEGTGVIFADVKPIFENHCMACHSSISPKWTDYDQAIKFVKNGALKKRVVIQKSMPKEGSPQASAITDEERELIGLWADGGGKLTADSPSVPVDEGGGESSGPIWGIANKCNSCHGSDLPNSNKNIPMLAGQKSDFIISQLKSFANGTREDFVMDGAMNGVAEALTEEEIRMVASLFSSLTPKLPDPEDVSGMTEIQNVIPVCALCHFGEDNLSQADSYPNIAGQNKDYLVNQMLNFKDGTRTDIIGNGYMNFLMGNLDEAFVLDLATYISNLRENKGN